MIDGRKDNDLREDSRRKCRVLGVWRGELRNGNGCSAGRREAGGERWTGRWERMRNDGQGKGRRGGAGRGLCRNVFLPRIAQVITDFLLITFHLKSLCVVLCHSVVSFGIPLTGRAPPLFSRSSSPVPRLAGRLSLRFADSVSARFPRRDL